MRSQYRISVALMSNVHAPGVIGLISKPSVEAIAISRLVLRYLVRQGVQVFLEKSTSAQISDQEDVCSCSFEELGASTDLALVVGGDGTMLFAARELASFGTPLLGINLGRVGFMTDLDPNLLEEGLEFALSARGVIDRRMLLDVAVEREGAQIFTGKALNDLVISRNGNNGLIEMSVNNGENRLFNVRSSGLILSTPTGSTAYNLSAGGPILDPSLAGFIVFPIAAQDLSIRPIVVNDDSVITIEMSGLESGQLNLDMHTSSFLQKGDSIIVKKADFYAHFLHDIGWNFYDVLRNKLHWNLPV